MVHKAVNSVCYRQARDLYTRAAKLGYDRAQFNLGVLRYSAAVAEDDFKAAAKWFFLAAKQNYGSAQHALAKMYAKGEGVPWDYAEAWFWMTVAAEGGYKGAKRALPSLEKKLSADQRRRAEELLQTRKRRG